MIKKREIFSCCWTKVSDSNGKYVAAEVEIKPSGNSNKGYYVVQLLDESLRKTPFEAFERHDDLLVESKEEADLLK